MRCHHSFVHSSIAFFAFHFKNFILLSCCARAHQLRERVETRTHSYVAGAFQLTAGAVLQSQMLMQLGDMDAAEDLLQETLNRNGGFRDGLRQLALLYSFTNRTIEASEWIQKALRLCPNGATECAPLLADYGDILKDMSNLNRSAEVCAIPVQLFHMSSLLASAKRTQKERKKKNERRGGKEGEEENHSKAAIYAET